ncbi:hypothetical protein M1N21_00380 [Dehalococcoidia bacterium]|nr:hypothetical protein [Dehalococcoidia bacterium]
MAEYEVIRYHGHPESPTEEVLGCISWDADRRDLSYEVWNSELAKLLAEVKRRRAVKRFEVGPELEREDVLVDNIVDAPMDDPRFITYLDDWLANYGFNLVETER